MVIAESPVKCAIDSATSSSVPAASQLMRRSSFYSEKPSRNISKYAKLEERMTQKVLSPPSQKFDSTYVAGSWLTSPRRITPKALFGSLLSSSPLDKAGTNPPRKLSLKSPVRNAGCSVATLDFKTPVKVVHGGHSASSAVVASPLRPAVSGLSLLGLDSPSRNTRSQMLAGNQSCQSEAVVTQQVLPFSSPSSVGRRYSRLMSPTHVALTSPDFKRQSERLSGRLEAGVTDSLLAPVDKSLRSSDNTRQIAACSSNHVITSSRARRVCLTKCDDDVSFVMKSDTDHITGLRGKLLVEAPELDNRLPQKRYLLPTQSPKSSLTFSSSSKLAQPLNQSVDRIKDISDILASAGAEADSRIVENSMSYGRKKSGKAVIGKYTRKKSHRQIHMDSHSSINEQVQSTIAGNICDNKQPDESASFLRLSFGCDVERNDDARTAVVNQSENLNCDVLRHLGSSGVESESSSNDVDLMVARKFMLGRKRSSGFQSLGHISETECCPSPVFPTISNEPAVNLSDQHAACDSVSTSPVFGKKQMQSSTGESPRLSLLGSGCKRTPVPGCIESFSPDVSQHSIAHLMTSPLLNGSDTQPKTNRNRSSTRRCLDQQMYQSGRRLSVGRDSSSKLTDEDN